MPEQLLERPYYIACLVSHSGWPYFIVLRSSLVDEPIMVARHGVLNLPFSMPSKPQQPIEGFHLFRRMGQLPGRAPTDGGARRARRPG